MDHGCSHECCKHGRCKNHSPEWKEVDKKQTKVRLNWLSKLVAVAKLRCCQKPMEPYETITEQECAKCKRKRDLYSTKIAGLLDFKCSCCGYARFVSSNQLTKMGLLVIGAVIFMLFTVRIISKIGSFPPELMGSAILLLIISIIVSAVMGWKAICNKISI